MFIDRIEAFILLTKAKREAEGYALASIETRSWEEKRFSSGWSTSDVTEHEVVVVGLVVEVILVYLQFVKNTKNKWCSA